jgi:hypothetical protein
MLAFNVVKSLEKQITYLGNILSKNANIKVEFDSIYIQSLELNLNLWK